MAMRAKRTYTLQSQDSINYPLDRLSYLYCLVLPILIQFGLLLCQFYFLEAARIFSVVQANRVVTISKSFSSPSVNRTSNEGVLGHDEPSILMQRYSQCMCRLIRIVSEFRRYHGVRHGITKTWIEDCRQSNTGYFECVTIVLQGLLSIK